MELYHLIHSFSMFSLVMVGLGNVCWVIELDDVSIQRVCNCCQLSVDTVTV